MVSLQELIAIICYVAILFSIGIWSAYRHQTASDFLIGARSLNFYLTALSAHASDMSAWLFMGLPAAIFSKGLFEAWFAIGLIFFMALNWLFIAPRIRVKTEEYNSLTFSSFFESRFHDTSGMIRIFTALILLLFYTIYLAAGAIAMGELIEVLFNVNYEVGVTVGIILVTLYLFIGGYRTLAWVDCFQAIFLFIIISIVPFVILPKIGGFKGIKLAFETSGLSLSLLPDATHSTLSLFILLMSWGIGYFGQPHILTKFMGINRASDLRKSMAVGLSWQLIVISAATLIGLIGVPFFTQGLANPEYVFISMVKDAFPPMAAAFILCAVLAAILSTMDSQLLVLASSLTEDFYKRLFRKTAGSKELLWISRFFILLIAALIYLFALFFGGNRASIFNLVFYGWAGLGASFGPLMIFALFSKKTNKYGAWAGILTGGIGVNLWIYFFDRSSALLVSFLLSSLAIYIGSKLTYGRSAKTGGLKPL